MSMSFGTTAETGEVVCYNYNKGLGKVVIDGENGTLHFYDFHLSCFDSPNLPQKGEPVEIVFNRDKELLRIYADRRRRLK